MSLKLITSQVIQIARPITGRICPVRLKGLTVLLSGRRGGRGSAVVRLSLDRAVRVRALAGDIVLCSWRKHFNLTVPLSTQVIKWITESQ